MARPAHTAITYKGTFGPTSAPSEQWQVTLRYDEDVTLLSQNGRDILATACADVFVADVMPQYSLAVGFTGVEVRAIGADGKEPRDASGAFSGQGFDERNVQGNAANRMYFPLQTALVLSLTTGRAGASGKGRVFMPYPGFPLQTSFLVGESSVEDFLSACQGWLANINALVTGGLVVASSKGYLSPVTGLRCGLVPDTQRSRRSDLIEGYKVLPFP